MKDMDQEQFVEHVVRTVDRCFLWARRAGRVASFSEHVFLAGFIFLAASVYARLLDRIILPELFFLVYLLCVVLYVLLCMYCVLVTVLVQRRLDRLSDETDEAIKRFPGLGPPR
jgi:uncharacterized membrane protein